jgi:catechol 2,3-dioxygenase-like lactoylglutathione lyase family enzyme
MFTHAFLGTNSVEASRKFYNAVMAALGHDHAVELPDRTIYPTETGTAFIVAAPLNGAAHTVSNGHTLGFAAKDYAAVDAFHAAGVANGGSDEGAPGFRESSPGNQYGAYLRDPDGNKICAYTPNVGPKA